MSGQHPVGVAERVQTKAVSQQVAFGSRTWGHPSGTEWEKGVTPLSQAFTKGLFLQP